MGSAVGKSLSYVATFAVASNGTGFAALGPSISGDVLELLSVFGNSDAAGAYTSEPLVVSLYSSMRKPADYAEAILGVPVLTGIALFPTPIVNAGGVTFVYNLPGFRVPLSVRMSQTDRFISATFANPAALPAFSGSAFIGFFRADSRAEKTPTP